MGFRGFLLPLSCLLPEFNEFLCIMECFISLLMSSISTSFPLKWKVSVLEETAIQHSNWPPSSQTLPATILQWAMGGRLQKVWLSGSPTLARHGNLVSCLFWLCLSVSGLPFVLSLRGISSAVKYKCRKGRKSETGKLFKWTSPAVITCL